MVIGNNDTDFIDEQDDFTPNDVDQNDTNLNQNDPSQGNTSQGDTSDGNQDNQDDFILALLKSRGIEDKSKIKFENDEGSLEELNWDNLSNDEKLNILDSSMSDPDTDLDDEEAQLINSIRESGMTPSEYINNLQQQGVNTYIQNSQVNNRQYQVDQYSDDELFIYDFITRMGDVTEEEAQEALDRAKSNESLFQKQVAAIRNEYKSIEEENARQAQLEQEEEAREQYNEFSSHIADQISNFNEYSGYNLNLDDDDKDQLYEFITGFDGAGNNYFAKALSDPKILVQTAWFALNGQQMMEDITNYFQNEIKQVRRESYEKGLADAKGKMTNSQVVFIDKQHGSHTDTFTDLDEF